MELTDLEICKRIAEIEGYSKFGTVWGDLVIVSNEDDTTSYNPLTDDALCFRLMVKYGITFDFYTHDNGHKVYYGWVDNKGIDVEVKDCETLNMFILLAIIEAHNHEL